MLKVSMYFLNNVLLYEFEGNVLILSHLASIRRFMADFLLRWVLVQCSLIIVNCSVKI